MVIVESGYNSTLFLYDIKPQYKNILLFIKFYVYQKMDKCVIIVYKGKIRFKNRRLKNE